VSPVPPCSSSDREKSASSYNRTGALSPGTGAQPSPLLRLGFFDLSLGFVQDAALTQFLVGATPGGNLPDDLATFMLGAFLHSGITGISADYVFVVVQ
jgi:hypothetical protein